MFAATIAIAFMAGMLSILSPCILPLLPIIFAAASSKNKLGPVLITIGVSLSFSTLGLIFAAIGYNVNLNDEILRKTSAIIMIAFGLSIFFSYSKYYTSIISGKLSNSFQDYFDRASLETHSGSFVTGCLLGAVWSPCAGPTLGSATLLASQRGSFVQAGMTMIAYGIGATLPMLLIGVIAQNMAYKSRSNLLSAGLYGKIILGISLILIGAMITSGMDKIIEKQVVAIMPYWVISLTTIL